MTETVDSVAAPPEEETAVQEEEQEQESESVTELAAQLGRDLSVLAFCEGQLIAARHMPEVRRTARDIAAAAVAGIAFLIAFVFVNVAAMLGLSSAVSPWLAAVILALVWVAIGVVLVLVLMVRAGKVTGWKWWRVFAAGHDEAMKDLECARDQAEEAVRETLTKLGPAVTVEIASAAVPVAGEMADGVVDAAGGILEASDDAVEAIAEDLPGGSVVNQMWDVALMPGRFGLRVATTVLKRDDS